MSSPGKFSNSEEDVKTRAYAIWEKEGRPEGKHLEHWRRAAEQTGGSAAPSPTPAAQPASKQKRKNAV